MLFLFLFIFGLSVGSFLNVLIDRLPKGESILGRSYCDHCKTKIKSLDLVPILSFLNLKGKCRYCGKKISWKYPLIELLTGVIFVLGFLYIPVDAILVKIFYLGLLSCLIVIFFTDAKFQIIPTQIQIALFLLSAMILIFSGFDLTKILSRTLDGFLTMLPILLIYFLTKGQGMGDADVIFSFNLGFLLGIFDGFVAIYIAFVIGAIFGLTLIVLKRARLKSKIALGSFLVLGVVVMIFFANILNPVISLFLWNAH